MRSILWIQKVSIYLAKTFKPYAIFYKNELAYPYRYSKRLPKVNASN